MPTVLTDSLPDTCVRRISRSSSAIAFHVLVRLLRAWRLWCGNVKEPSTRLTQTAACRTAIFRRHGGPAAPAQGFTLVELMVALLVFGMIAGAGALLLATGVDSQARVAERLDASAQLRRAHALLSADMAQAVARPTRGGPTGQRPAFAGGGAGPIALLVRAGWDNPGGDPRPNLQRVEYRVEGGRLMRLTAAALDGGEPGNPLVLVEGVRVATARYRADEGWRDVWDPVDPTLLPRAIEINLTLAGGRSLTQRFMVAA
ncbi:type II secretion system protein GspJ [Sphingomonas gilva]|uniref:Type II secretion system protein J n=1 Tax=Sphingomonas gilva TaxID=2305907 RepID=A0A396RP20_9SPHN|nr:type II secretion system minor pseudopilin GspJ [Sphingomonas gilva]RHW16962.1 type II secretion system protein GspJ [Sphingomonas gilva]